MQKPPRPGKNVLGTLIVAFLASGACRKPASGHPEMQVEPPQGATAGTSSVNPRSTASNDARPSRVEASDGATALLAPLAGDWLEKMPDATGKAVFVAPPIGAREPRPVLVAVHGAGDRPEWACGGWRLASRAYGFVVCPEGTSTAGQRFAWRSPRAIAERVQHALVVVRERYGAYVAEGPAMYAGFSQGATLSQIALLDVPGRFSIAVFAEGGYDLIASPTFASRFASAGGQRVLVVCGGAPCFTRARVAERVLSAAGLEVSTAGDLRAGHNLNDRMQKALQAAWPEVVSGEKSWVEFR